MTARSWNMRTTLTAIFALGALLSAGLSAMADPTDQARLPEGGASPDDATLSVPARASAELAAEQGVTLERQVLEELDTQGATDFWVEFEDKADLSGAEEMTDWAERGQHVYDQLVETAQASQAELTMWLGAAEVDFESFWIANTMVVRDGDQTVLDGMLVRPGVAQIRADEAVQLPDPIDSSGGASVAAVEWGIANIRADEVWSQFGVRGEGIVVGSIDTGVEFTHPALVSQYRGNVGDGEFDHNYNWWDPSNVCPDEEPCDNNNHGTHTTGTMVGDDGAGNQVGVAPRAEWIAAKGCETNNCSESALLSSGQFMLAPTDLNGENPRPELRPHIVNNSWGDENGPSVDPSYRDIVTAWTAAGIFGVFSNGNDGPGCDTAGSPADLVESWGVGAYNSNNQIAGFSSRGPGEGGAIRPSISAPGVNVRSSLPGGVYGNFSGTSMAAPHQSGAIALMWSASGQPGDITATREALDATAVDTEDLSCGGTPENNNVYGQGRLDAYQAVSRVALDSGVRGRVTDADGAPLANVRVGVVETRSSTRTGADGGYELRLHPGTYTVEFSRFGYTTETVTNVVVVDDEISTVDVTLELAPSGSVSGTVTDAVSGQTIPGVEVEVLEVPADLSAVTHSAGGYEISGIPVGSHQVRATSLSHVSVTFEVTVTEGAVSPADISLDPFGSVERVSVSSAGVEADDDSQDAAISADGRYVAFHSEAGNLVENPPPVRGVYVRDRVTGVTELISPAPLVKPGVDISADGRYVAFFSSAPYQSHDGVYVYDRESGTTELVSVSSDGEPADGFEDPGNSPDPAISGDGRYVAFASATPKLHEELPDQCRWQDRGGNWWTKEGPCSQIYVHDRETGETELVSRHSDGEPGDGGTTTGRPAISADGRYVAFESNTTNLVDDEVWETSPTFGSTPAPHVYVHDRETGTTEWASVRGPDDPPSGARPGGWQADISDDGRFVSYLSPLRIGLPEFLERVNCIAICAFVYDRATGETDLLPPLDDVEHEPPFLVGSNSPAIGGDASVAFWSFAVTCEGLAVLDCLVGIAEGDIPLIPEVSGGLIFGPGTGQLERWWDAPDVDSATPVDLSISSDARFVAFSASDKAMPGVSNGVGDVYVLDREFDPNEPHERFALWDLAVEPQRPLSGDPVQFTARVKNVGNAGGEFPAVLFVGGRQEAARTVTLAPGEATQVSWVVTRDEPGTYEVSVGNLAGEMEVLDRAPVIDLEPDSLALTVESGQAQTAQVTIANPGFDQPLEWQLTEDQGVDTGLVQPAGTVTVPASGPRPRAATGLSIAPKTKDGGDGAVASYPLVSPDEATTLTHSESLDVFENHSGACTYEADGTTAANQYLRTFTLADFGIAAGFNVTEVTFGIDRLTVTAPIGVNLYTLEGEFTYENLTLIGTTAESLPAQELSLVTVPVTGSAPAGSTLVVEIAAPDLFEEGEFWLGANDLGQTAPSYLAASLCGVDDPATLESLGAGHIHLVMAVTGEPVDLELPDWLEVAPSTGTVASGTSEDVAVTVDASGLAPGVYRVNLGIASNDPSTPLAVVPVTLEVTEAAPVTFDSLRDSVEVFEGDGDVTKAGAARLLSAVGQAERHHDRGADDRAIMVLERFQETAGDPRFVPGEAARDALVADADRLIEQLREGLSGPGATAPAEGEVVPV